ncbi:MAG: hypothetical protein ACC652_13840, partial [Acidimicrobiales bacterium]
MSGAFLPLYQLFVRSLLSRGRVVGISILGLTMAGLAYVVGNNADTASDQAQQVSEFIQVFGMSLLAPF